MEVGYQHETLIDKIRESEVVKQQTYIYIYIKESMTLQVVLLVKCC